MSVGPSPLLLDTCAVIWLANGELSEDVAALVMNAGLAGGIFVSPVSAWEIGMLSRPRQGRAPAYSFLPDPKTWFARVMSGPAIRQAPFTPDIAIDAYHLPSELHGDPGDRLMISTSRNMRIPILTRDSKILEYGAAGHVDVIAC